VKTRIYASENRFFAGMNLNWFVRRNCFFTASALYDAKVTDRIGRHPMMPFHCPRVTFGKHYQRLKR
jgi:hypothetical protein